MPRANRNKIRGGGRGRGGGQASDTRQQGQGRGLVRRPEKTPRPARGCARGQPRQPSGTVRARRGNSLVVPRTIHEPKEDGFVRHQELPKAHGDAVMGIVMADDAIYTASRDKFLKRWKAQRNASNRFELVPDLEVPLGEVCWSLTIAGEWLFCGLGDGTIKSFSKTGREAALKGHTKRVGSLLVHQHVMLSGGSDAVLRCWQLDPSSQSFSCTHTLEQGIPGAISCMSVLGEQLWVGGASGLCVVDLASLRVARQLPPRKFVSALLQFEGHMIAVYADGSVCIFDAAGVQKHSQPPMPAGPVLCMAGLESGPRVLCGHAKGQVSSIMLPSFQMKMFWHALERCQVQSICCAGHDGIFILGAQNGSLQLWQREDTLDL